MLSNAHRMVRPAVATPALVLAANAVRIQATPTWTTLLPLRRFAPAMRHLQFHALLTARVASPSRAAPGQPAAGLSVLAKVPVASETLVVTSIPAEQAVLLAAMPALLQATTAASLEASSGRWSTPRIALTARGGCSLCKGRLCPRCITNQE